MAEPIAFYFDFSSPYGYLASHKIDDVGRLYGREVDWRPFLLGVVFKESGNAPLLGQPLKGAYAERDFARSARLIGVPMALPGKFPFASTAACRVFYWLKDKDAAAAKAFARAVYDAAFAGGGADVSSPDEVADIAARLGHDRAAVVAAMNDPAVKQRLFAENDAAIKAGVCGSPFFVVDGEPFWGNDRLDQVERWLATGGW